MTNQFTVRNFARGVRLTLSHQYDPETDVATAAAGTGVERTVEQLGATRASWVIPWVSPVDDRQGPLYMPFAMPPFQERFDRVTLHDPDYRVALSEFSLSFDQRAEPYGIVGAGSKSPFGVLTNCDMSRYDMVLRLLERRPSLITGDVWSSTEVLKLEVPGVLTYGNPFLRDNPLLLDELRIAIKPFGTYVWELSVPGLCPFAATGRLEKYEFKVNAGGYVPGDTAQLVVGAEPAYNYVVAIGDTPDLIALGLATAASAGPSAYTVTAANDGTGNFSVVAPDPETAAVVTASFLGPSLGTITLTLHVTNIPRTLDILSLVSLNLSCVFLSALTRRDEFDIDPLVDPTVQNMPIKHMGAHAPTVLNIVAPAADAVITGTDIQSANQVLDRELRKRAESGFGAGYGAAGNPMQASDRAPEELLERDAHYMMVVVNLYGGMGPKTPLRSADVVAANLPFLSIPYTAPTVDRRILPIPENFVLHHAFAVWNYNGGVRSASATYLQKVGINIYAVLRSDDCLGQQVAYLEWTGANYNTFCVDEFNLGAYAMLNIPLVGPGALVNPHGWNAGVVSGVPFYMGRANHTTAPRTPCGVMPPAPFAGGAYHSPSTKGQENALEVMWTKEDSAGLDTTTGAVIGYGGEWVILCGKVTLSA